MWLLISLCRRAQLLLKSYLHSSRSILFFWSSHLLFSSETSPFKISNSAFKLSSSQSLLTLQLAAYPLFFRVLRYICLDVVIVPEVDMLIGSSSTSIVFLRGASHPSICLFSLSDLRSTHLCAYIIDQTSHVTYITFLT